LLYEIKIQLRYINPPVYRILRIPSRTSLLKFHKLLQRSMGWKNYHAYLFEVEWKRYGEHPEQWDFEVFDFHAITLEKIFSGGTKSLIYDYDMGDGWRHDIELLGTLEVEGKEEPACIAGARACPPEDCGGTPGYENLLETLADPMHEEHDELLEWIGGKYDPEKFDLEAVDRALKRLR
jgi:pRiA4b ORF-3-like protein